MALSQSIPEIYVPTFELVAGNKRLDQLVAKSILEISVTETADPPGQFSFRLNDPKLDFVDKDKGVFREGKRVEISLGFVGRTRKMITGEVSAVAVDFPSSGAATVEVQGFDLSHRGTRGTVYRKFGGTGPSSSSGFRVSDFVSQIASEMGLKSTVDQTPLTTLPWTQDNQTNLSFLQKLAQATGCFLWMDGDRLYFTKDRLKNPNTIRLERGKTLLSFSPRLSTAGLVDTVEVRGWDPNQKQSFAVRVQRSRGAAGLMSQAAQQQIRMGAGGTSQRIIRDAPVFSVSEAQTLAETVLRTQEESTFTGNGSSIGQPDMRVGTKLELKGVGRFNGTYAVTRVTHSVGGSGYTTSFEVNSGAVRSAPDLSDLLGSLGQGDRARTGGVVIGLVMNNKDDQGLGRVQVKYPGSSDGDIGHWMRLGAPMAGSGAGMFFLPEKNDEVLVAFEQGDVARPYVLGALWNGIDKPPDTNANGENNLRFIKSRSGHVIRLDDTDRAEKIEIVDKSGDNQITFDTANNTITIASAQDVAIEAPNGSISLSAKSIEVKSTAETKVEAQTTMNLAASNTMTIKGATVNIN